MAGPADLDGSHNFRYMRLDHGALVTAENHHSKLALLEILLITDSLIGGNEYLEAVLFGSLQENPIAQCFPSLKRHCADVMSRNQHSQPVREILIEQYLHGLRAR